MNEIRNERDKLQSRVANMERPTEHNNALIQELMESMNKSSTIDEIQDEDGTNPPPLSPPTTLTTPTPPSSSSMPPPFFVIDSHGNKVEDSNSLHLHAATRVEEIRRLLVLAEEESDRAETESEALYYHQYDVVLAEPPRNKVCAVCYSPTTTDCPRCKMVHYWVHKDGGFNRGLWGRHIRCLMK
ncbi:hypothetical protein JHK84_049576 [Glycine max]|nr:hypothetical protein JHK86_049545 [Glycine max]KAG5093988.1 hypothetical protein JHK84_049576 [Glycine max]